MILINVHDLNTNSLQMPEPLNYNDEYEKLRSKEFGLQDLISIDEIQQLVTQYCKITKHAIAIVDTDNNVLVAAGWQRICSDFHRKHPYTLKNCHASDQYISKYLSKREAVAYKCQNGLWDYAFPIIIDDKHLANIYFGQFFYDTDEINYGFFENQALKNNFDKHEYLKALNEVPRLSKEEVDAIMSYYVCLAQLIIKLGKTNLILKQEKILEKKISKEKLIEREYKLSELNSEYQTINEELKITNEELMSTNEELHQLNEELIVTTDALRESENKLKLAQSIAHLGYYVYDIKNDKWENSEVLNTIFGIDTTYKKDFSGWLHLIHPEYKDKMFIFFRNNVLRLNESFDKIYKIINQKSGKELWVHGTGELELDANGVPIRMFGVIQDITKQKESEEALNENRRKLNLAISAANIGYFERNVQDRKIPLEVNDNYVKILGFETKDEIDTSPAFIESLLHPDDMQIFHRERNNHISGNTQRLSVEVRFKTKSGKYKWLAIEGKLTKFDHENKPQILQGFIIDIDKIKQTEAKLKEREERLNLALEGASDGLWDWNLETNEIFYSPAWKKLLGYRDNELVNTYATWEKLVHPDDIQNAKEKIDEYLSGKINRFETEFRMKHKNDEWITILSRGIKKYDKNGHKAIRFIGTHVDITKLRKVEKELRKVNATKDRLLSIIAHDLKNPFSTILGFSSLLSEEIENKNYDRIIEFSQMINTSTNQIFNLLTNLLDWTRIQTGTIKVYKEEIILDEIIEDILELYNPTLSNKKIIIKRAFNENIQINSDRNIVNTVLRNILSNAIKFTETNGAIKIDLKIQKPEILTISIIDTGIGMSEEELKKLSEPENVVSQKGTNNESGSGLGLMLCKELLEKINGEIKISSKIKQGTNVTICLPIK